MLSSRARAIFGSKFVEFHALLAYPFRRQIAGKTSQIVDMLLVTETPLGTPDSQQGL